VIPKIMPALASLALVLHAQAGDLMVGAQARDDDRGEHHDAHGQRQGCVAGLVELAGLAVVRPQEDVVGQDDRQHRAHGLKQVPEAQQGRALVVVGRKLGHERGVGDLVEADHQP
jgi:hypothetical protein